MTCISIISVLLLILERGESFAFLSLHKTRICTSTCSFWGAQQRRGASSHDLPYLKAKASDSAGTETAVEQPVNGDDPQFEKLENVTVTIDESQLIPTAPHLSYKKFLTMQDKRVVVTIRYSGDAGLKPYFLTVAKKLKASHPDVIIERRILTPAEDGEEATFEVLVDGKIIVGKGKPRKQKVARVDMAQSRSVFVSMQELDVAISRARRRRRPSTLYGEEETAQNLEAMRKSVEPQQIEDGSSE